MCNLCHTYLQPLLGCKSLVSKTLSLLMDGVISEDFQQHERGARDQDQYLKYKENVASHQSHVSLICHTMSS